MSLVAIGLGLLSVGAAGTFAYALYQGHQKMTRLLDMQTLLRESQATHFHHLNLATEGVLSDVRSLQTCLLYTSPSPRDVSRSRMPSSA